MSVHEKALKGIYDDLDGFESKKMFGGDKPEGSGFSITISVDPSGAVSDESDGGDESSSDDMCKGGMAMSDGGEVPEMGETDDLTLPPFLRKKKQMMGK